MYSTWMKHLEKGASTGTVLSSNWVFTLTYLQPRGINICSGQLLSSIYELPGETCLFYRTCMPRMRRQSIVIS